MGLPTTALSLPPGVAALLPPPECAALLRGQRVATASAGGPLVWHVWQPLAAAGALGGQPPVLLLHGGSGSWTHWLRNVPALVQAGRCVWAVDLPGCGESALPPGPLQDVPAMLEPLLQGLPQLGLGQAPLDVVGFSFGAAVACLLAAATLVRRLVLVGAPAMGLPAVGQWRPRAWRHAPDAAARQQAHRANLRGLMLHDDAHLTPLALLLHIHNAERDRLSRRRPARGGDVRQSLAHVPCPVHAIYGAHDALYPGQMPDLAAAFAQACPQPGSFHAIADAGHWVQFAQPRAFDAALAQVLV